MMLHSYPLLISIYKGEGRISDNTAFFLLGEVVEFDNTEKLFANPSDKRTEDYITGRFG